jgi:hypothetical protein
LNPIFVDILGIAPQISPDRPASTNRANRLSFRFRRRRFAAVIRPAGSGFPAWANHN